MGPRHENWLSILRHGLRWGTLLAVLGLVADFGLPLGAGQRTGLRSAQLALIGLFVLDLALRVGWAERRWSYVRAHLFEPALAALVLADLGLWLASGAEAALGGAWFSRHSGLPRAALRAGALGRPELDLAPRRAAGGEQAGGGRGHGEPPAARAGGRGRSR
jgi:hypothetical protein